MGFTELTLRVEGERRLSLSSVAKYGAAGYPPPNIHITREGEFTTLQLCDVIASVVALHTNRDLLRLQLSGSTESKSLLGEG